GGTSVESWRAGASAPCSDSPRILPILTAQGAGATVPPRARKVRIGRSRLHGSPGESVAGRVVPLVGPGPHHRGVAGRVLRAVPLGPLLHPARRAGVRPPPPHAAARAPGRDDRVPPGGDVRGPPAAALPRGAGRGGEGRGAHGAVRDGDEFRPARAARVARRGGDVRRRV